MKMRKLLPVILLVFLAVITVMLRRCNSNTTHTGKVEKPAAPVSSSQRPRSSVGLNSGGLDRNASELYFTKHVKCRMACRKITQQEVRQILATGTINYNKSKLDDLKGPTYAVEGTTSDGQLVRIIFAPKKNHISVVTVIDLEHEYACNCD